MHGRVLNSASAHALWGARARNEQREYIARKYVYRSCNKVCLQFSPFYPLPSSLGSRNTVRNAANAVSRVDVRDGYLGNVRLQATLSLGDPL